jgi:F-box and WD-40 domain protein CDC4
MAWKSLCEKHSYRKLSKDDEDEPYDRDMPDDDDDSFNPSWARGTTGEPSHTMELSKSTGDHTGQNNGARVTEYLRTQSLDRAGKKKQHRRPKAMTYKSHFKQRYMVETAWRSGGKCDSRQITPDQGVVTSLHLTPKHIVVALDNAKIHVFDVDGYHQKTLQGHVMGVWAMVPWGDLLVSGGCDRDVRVWNLLTGYVPWRHCLIAICVH